MVWNERDRCRDAGLLILRIGIGIAFMVHGTSTLFNGLSYWATVGQER
jgi:uncharacterized membrane protein YphA (DoxX/SURF4 family)